MVKTSSIVVAGLESSLTDIRKRHPDVPEAVIALAGSRRKLGHYAHNRWDRDGNELGELFISGEGLRQGAPSVLGTLLHEAAHGIAAVRGIQDTSRNGRYHNKRYVALAEELGLKVQRRGSVGWSDTSPPDTLLDSYASTIRRLEKTLNAWRKGDQQVKAPSRNLALAVCECERRIRVAPATYSEGPIICGNCSGPFTVTAPIAT
jgi:hypothetical protein